MKKQMMKVALIAAALAVAGFAHADESGLNGSISGFATTHWGAGGAVGQVAGVAGTSGYSGTTAVNTAGRINLDMWGKHADGFATSFGGMTASQGYGAAMVNGSSFNAGSVSVVNGQGTVSTNGSVGGSAVSYHWH